MDSKISELIQQAKAKEQERLEADRHAKLLKNEEDELKAQLMSSMLDMGLTELSMAGVRAVITEKAKPFIVDYTALETYIVEHRAIDLLQKRLTESAVKLRWEDGIKIPGVGLVTEKKLQLK